MAQNRKRRRKRELRQVRRKLERVQADFDRDCADVERVRADALRSPETRALLTEADEKLSRKAARIAQVRGQLADLETGG